MADFGRVKFPRENTASLVKCGLTLAPIRGVRLLNDKYRLRCFDYD